jgi:membrane-associated phospholipid phosphatase
MSPRKRHWFHLPAVLLIGAGLSLALLAIGASRHSYFQWDLSVTAAIQGISHPVFHGLMYWTSYPGNQLNAWIFGLAVGLTLFLARKRTEGVVLLAGTSSGALFNALLKAWVGRPRPTDSLVQIWIDYPAASFPSGHVMFYVQLFGFLAWLAWRTERKKIAFLSGLPILLVGPSRVYLGAHWSSDVLGGYLGGVLWLALMVRLHLELESRNRLK